MAAQWFNADPLDVMRWLSAKGDMRGRLLGNLKSVFVDGYELGKCKADKT